MITKVIGPKHLTMFIIKQTASGSGPIHIRRMSNPTMTTSYIITWNWNFFQTVEIVIEIWFSYKPQSKCMIPIDWWVFGMEPLFQKIHTIQLHQWIQRRLSQFRMQWCLQYKATHGQYMDQLSNVLIFRLGREPILYFGCSYLSNDVPCQLLVDENRRNHLLEYESVEFDKNILM